MMRIVCLQSTRGPLYGVVQDGDVYALDGDLFGSWSIGSRVCALEEAQLLPPTSPSKIIAIGKNYLEHAREVDGDMPDEPLMFLKPPTAVIGHLDSIVYPPISQRVDYEGELAVIIGRTCRNVAPGEAHKYILGFTCANDVTARDLQRKDGQWTRGKGFDTFLPLGPYIVTDFAWTEAVVQTRLNGQVKQSAPCNQMAFSVERLISHAAQVMTLLPGDVLLTGTPSGIGPMMPGDVVEVEISGIGVLRNNVVAARP